MNDTENAYFTVEAALVLPMVLGVILFVIYLALFQYNRCLLEQDIGALAMKGCTLSRGEKELLLLELEEHAGEIYQEKYIGWKSDGINIKLTGDKVTVSGAGELGFPFGGSLGGIADSEWAASAEYTNQRIDPVDYIRLYRKIEGGE